MLEKHHIIQEIPMDISEIIQSHYDSLTKKQRLIADYILENPMEALVQFPSRITIEDTICPKPTDSRAK